MPKKAVVVLLLGLAFVLVRLAEAQQQAKVAKIGYLSFRSGGPTPGTEVFRRELRALGYVEGKNIAFEYRSAEGKFERFPALVDELVRLKVDVLLTPGTPAALAAKNATRTIPIVFTAVADPVSTGLVDSLARPGETSRGSPRFRRCWLASVWSYSRKPFPSSPGLRCCGIHEIQAMRNNGKKANWRQEDSGCSFIPWR